VQLLRQAPAAWFTAIAPRLKELNTRDKLFELLNATKASALQFSAEKRVAFVSQKAAPATQAALRSAFSVVDARRQKAAGLQVVRPDLLGWADFRRAAEEHASLGDIIDGRHGQPVLARAAAGELESIEQVATCLHAEFAAVPPAYVWRGWSATASSTARPLCGIFRRFRATAACRARPGSGFRSSWIGCSEGSRRRRQMPST